MRFPVLQSPANPNAPRSAPAILTPLELNKLARCMVAILGVDRVDGRFEVLGTGFVIAAGAGHLQILTASHVIRDFLNKLSYQKSHALQGLDIEEDLRVEKRRFEKLMRDGSVQVIQLLFQAGSPPNQKAVLQDVQWMNFGADPRYSDLALLQCPFPEGTTLRDFALLAFDDDPLDASDAVALAAFDFLLEERFIPFDDEAGLNRLRTRIRIDSGFITGHIEPEIVHGYRSHKRFNAGIPTRGGMSGGPMIRVRFPLGPPPKLIWAPSIDLLTASGVISRGLEDETEIVAIEEARHFEAMFADGPLTIGQQIERKMILTYTDIAHRMRTEKFVILPDGTPSFFSTGTSFKAAGEPLCDR